MISAFQQRISLTQRKESKKPSIKDVKTKIELKEQYTEETFIYKRFSETASTNNSARAWSNSVEYDAKALMFLVAVFFE